MNLIECQPPKVVSAGYIITGSDLAFSFGAKATQRFIGGYVRGRVAVIATWKTRGTQ
jgi:hypothetical protein